MTRSAKALAMILRRLGLLGEGESIVIRRTRSGRHQRACGAWSWWADRATGVEVCGSQYPISEILRAERDPRFDVVATKDVAGWSLDPEAKSLTD